MKLHLVFENSGDTLVYNVVHNHSLLEFFVEQSNKTNNNHFFDQRRLSTKLNKLLTEIHWALSKTNEILPHLIGKSFHQNLNIEDYLDQNFLNRQHCEWVFSQKKIINIDKLRFSKDVNQARLGSCLHEMYPDEIREELLPPIIEKLGYVYPFEEVNMCVHRLENSFKNLEYSALNKWEVFDNPIKDFYSANDITNFSFSYTYVGRQYYDKFVNWDNSLKYDDNYNYEILEYSFQLSLEKPQTIPYSEEFTKWAKINSLPMITSSLPIANLEDIEERLFDYRKILYRNSINNNASKLIIQ